MRHEILTANSSALAEGPLWHADHGRVYWVDIVTGTLYAFDRSANKTHTLHQGDPIGGFTMQEKNNGLLLFQAKGAIMLLEPFRSVVLYDELPGEGETRFNDVSADPRGRVFCGTMPTKDRLGRLYRLDTDRSIRTVLEDIGCSNGMGWSPDQKTMYYTDSGAKKIYAFDYDYDTGAIDGQRTFYELKTGGVPDGMTVDSQGNIWTAIWDGGCVIQLDPEGQEMQRIPLPAKKVTSPAFGGPDLTELYVTTAGGDQEDQGEGAGELLRLHDTGARGIPEFRSRIEV
ncbi:MAG TPA: SMP-30/gluconolactonase/LRE family protein [Fimbriimonas sp.]|nr:SMP-30/gluconolactonase/LRE family protein [Fimbriimonas sp.]